MTKIDKLLNLSELQNQPKFFYTNNFGIIIELYYDNIYNLLTFKVSDNIKGNFLLSLGVQLIDTDKTKAEKILNSFH